MERVIKLCDRTTKLLSSGWGDSVGWCSVGMWVASLAYLSAFLQNAHSNALITCAFCVYIPIVIASDTAAVSTLCAEVGDELTTKRMCVSTARTVATNLLRSTKKNSPDIDILRCLDLRKGPSKDLDFEHAIHRVEQILDKQNTKAGPGFIVFDRLIDDRALGTIRGALVTTGFAVSTQANNLSAVACDAYKSF